METLFTPGCCWGAWTRSSWLACSWSTWRSLAHQVKRVTAGAQSAAGTFGEHRGGQVRCVLLWRRRLRRRQIARAATLGPADFTAVPVDPRGCLAGDGLDLGTAALTDARRDGLGGSGDDSGLDSDAPVGLVAERSGLAGDCSGLNSVTLAFLERLLRLAVFFTGTSTTSTSPSSSTTSSLRLDDEAPLAE